MAKNRTNKPIVNKDNELKIIHLLTFIFILSFFIDNMYKLVAAKEVIGNQYQNVFAINITKIDSIINVKIPTKIISTI